MNDTVTIDDPVTWQDALTADAIAFLESLAPAPAPMPLLKWAATIRVPPDSPKAKNQRVRPLYDPREHHGQYEVLRILETRTYRTVSGEMIPIREVSVLACVQDGKSLCLDIWTAHGVIEESVHFVTGYPDRDLATKAWRAKLRPMIRGSGYGHRLPKTGPGSGDGAKPEDVLFMRGGRLYILGAGASNEAGQSAVTAERAKIDEVDSVRPRFVRLIANRTAAYGRRAIICKTSTLKFDEPRDSAIWQAWERGTHAVFQYECPHCHTWQPFEAEDQEGKLRLHYDDTNSVTARATAAIVCMHNGCLITETERRQCLTNYRLVMEGELVRPDGTLAGETKISTNWSIRWKAFDSPLEKNLGDLCVEHREAKQEIQDYENHERMRQLYRDEFVMPYTKDQHQTVELRMQTLFDRSTLSTYDAGEVPADVVFLTLAVDVQARWHYWTLRGFDRSGRRWLIAAGVENLLHLDGAEAGAPLGPGDPYTERHRADCMARLDAMRGNGWPRQGNPDERLVPVRSAVDCGWHVHELRPWLASHPTWVGTVGRGEAQVLRQQGGTESKRLVWVPGVCDVREQKDAWGLWPLWIVDVDQVRASVHDGFLAKLDSPRAGHLFRGIARKSATEWVARHLTGEMRKADPVSGEVTWQKRSASARVDLLDCCTYADALGLAHLEYLRSQQPPPPAGSAAPRTPPRRPPPIARRHSRMDRRN